MCQKLSLALPYPFLWTVLCAPHKLDPLPVQGASVGPARTLSSGPGLGNTSCSCVRMPELSHSHASLAARLRPTCDACGAACLAVSGRIREIKAPSKRAHLVAILRGTAPLFLGALLNCMLTCAVPPSHPQEPLAPVRAGGPHFRRRARSGRLHPPCIKPLHRVRNPTLGLATRKYHGVAGPPPPRRCDRLVPPRHPCMRPQRACQSCRTPSA